MILQEIAAKTILRVREEEQATPLSTVKKQAEELAQAEFNGKGFSFPFERALEGKDLSFICEVKKASPSKGVMAEYFPYTDIARDYQSAGAAAISVLTEPYYFKGDDLYLKEIADEVSIPVLRKDFTISPYMIYRAKILGASAILLICAILTDEQIKEYLKIADCLGLSAIVEAHTAEEVKRAIDCGARIAGVNNRDLATFNVDITTSLRLRTLVPDNVLYISESGIKTAEDVSALRECGVNGVLIGETLMRSNNKKAALDALRGVKYD